MRTDILVLSCLELKKAQLRNKTLKLTLLKPMSARNKGGGSKSSMVYAISACASVTSACGWLNSFVLQMLCSILCTAVYCEILKAGDTAKRKNSTAVLVFLSLHVI